MLDAASKRLYRKQAQVLQAVAHPIRLAIADSLRDGERCVCEIAGHVGSERSNVSRHLAIMLRAGVVECRKEGLMVYYSLRTPCILNFLSCASKVLRTNLAADAKALGRA